MDCTLSWMHENLPPKQWTLKRYCQINWMGSLDIEDVCESAELVAELPKSLIRKFLKSDDVDEVSLDGLLALVELAAEEEEEEEEEDEDEEEEEKEKEKEKEEEEDEDEEEEDEDEEDEEAE